MNSAGKPRWTVCEIQNKSEKLPDFSDQLKNGQYRSPTVFRPIPVTPYTIFIPITVFTE
jgi:hypothetical protein